LTQRAFAAFRPALLRVLRHTAVSLLKDAGVPDAVVMALVGHESSAMSHRYTHVGKEALARAAKTLPEV
jgi:integrase